MKPKCTHLKCMTVFSIWIDDRLLKGTPFPSLLCPDMVICHFTNSSQHDCKSYGPLKCRELHVIIQ